MNQPQIKIGIVDDHQLFLASLTMMLESLPDFTVVVEAVSGVDLQKKLVVDSNVPEIMLVDVNMPVMDGVATAQWLQTSYPAIKLIALTQNDKDVAIIQMFRAGCCAYLLKDVHPSILEQAIHAVYKQGYFNLDSVQFNPGRLFKVSGSDHIHSLSEREKTFLNHVCSELTYKQIASEMNVSERTVDGYRETLFEKLSVKSRVGLALLAVRQGIVII